MFRTEWAERRAGWLCRAFAEDGFDVSLRDVRVYRDSIGVTAHHRTAASYDERVRITLPDYVCCSG